MKFLVLVTVFIAGCYSITQNQISQFEDFTPGSRTFILLSPKHELDNELRKELSKRGFKIKKFASIVRRVDSNELDTRSEIYSPAEARYGLHFSTKSVFKCLLDKGWILVGAELEVSDLQTNEVIMVLSNPDLSQHNCNERTGSFEEFFKFTGQKLSEAWDS